MKCNNAQTYLVAYIDGELSGRALVQLEEHLGECGECRAALEDLRDLLESRVPPESPGPSRDLLPAIRGQIAASARVVPIRRLSLLAAAAAALLAAAWLYHADFFRGPGAEARSVARVLERVKDATGWRDVYAVAARLEISQVAAAGTLQASLVPLPSPKDEPFTISYKSGESGEFLQGILDPENYQTVTEEGNAGTACWVLRQPGKRLWVSRKTATPVRVDFRTAVGGWLSIRDIRYSRREGFLVPARFDVVLSGPAGEQSLKLTVTADEVKLLRQES